jgi:hypothetical protein
VKWPRNYLNCAYNSATAVAVAGAISHVTLFNNDNLGRVIAVHDVGRGGASVQLSGFFIQQGSIGSLQSPSQAVVSGEALVFGQLFKGSAIAADSPLMLNGVGLNTVLWAHDYPIAIVRQGFRFTAWGPAANTTITVGFWWEVLTEADLRGMEPAPTLVIPKVLKLSVETE